MYKITAIIPTYNEEANISRALESVLWADEIIVVDSFSTDRTREIALQYEGVKWLEHTFASPAKQKNWTIPQAEHAWIFILDADEMATPSLIKEIHQWKRKEEKSYAAYWIRRQNYFLGKKLKFIWKGDAVIRLFHRDQCRYEELSVHEEIVTDGKIGFLKNKIDHHTATHLSNYKVKMEKYAHWSALDYEKKTGRITFYHKKIKPFYRFFKHYILEGGIMDGKEGWIISKLMARGVRRRYEIIEEKRKLKK